MSRIKALGGLQEDAALLQYTCETIQLIPGSIQYRKVIQ